MANNNQIKSMLFVWLALILLDVFVVRDFAWISEHWDIKRVLVNLGLTSLAMLSLLFILKPMIGHSKIGRKLVFIAIAVPTLVQMSHYEVYRSFASSFGFHEFSQDPTMVLALWLEQLNVLKFIFILLAVYGLLRLIIVPIRIVKWRYGLNIIGFVLLYLLTTFSWYGVSNFQNSVLAYYSTLLQMSHNQVLKFKHEKPNIAPSRKPLDHLPNIVYIVGESLNFSQMSIYGYARNTTPQLSQLERDKKLIKYNNALSIGTNTRLSVPYMLVGMEGIDPKGRFYQTPSVFNYAKARGYTTAFISAQDTQWGHIKDLFVDGDVDYFWHGVTMNKDASVHKGADDMRVLNEIAMPYIDNITKQEKPFLLVLQMDGSHYPYNEHSTKQHKKFLPEDEPNSINAYDNTVVKTDDYLSKIIGKMRSNYPDSWVFYSSDHGQGLGGKSGQFNQDPHLNIIHNPLLISAPKSYYRVLMRNQNLPVSQADIVPSILAIIGMKPHANVNGKSLLDTQDSNRLRVVSQYMPTQHNDPRAVLVKPDLSVYTLDFEKMSVTFPDGKKAIRFKDWDKKYQQIFIDRGLY
jgi:glucan phosphoethanolaminetransferase (alkaline phosphatase superfamily)